MRLLTTVTALALASAQTEGLTGVAIGILAFIIILVAGVMMHVNEQRSRFRYEDTL